MTVNPFFVIIDLRTRYVRGLQFCSIRTRRERRSLSEVPPPLLLLGSRRPPSILFFALRFLPRWPWTNQGVKRSGWGGGWTSSAERHENNKAKGGVMGKLTSKRIIINYPDSQRGFIDVEEDEEGHWHHQRRLLQFSLPQRGCIRGYLSRIEFYDSLALPSSNRQKPGRRDNSKRS